MQNICFLNKNEVGTNEYFYSDLSQLKGEFDLRAREREIIKIEIESAKS